MELSNEETVTMLLSANEILHDRKESMFYTNPFESLGDFLKNVKQEQSPYEDKYVFIK